MTTIKKNLLPLFLITFLFGVSSCKPKLYTKVYKYNNVEPKFLEEIYLKNKPNIGIAFSGGGSRSASLTTGQLRALTLLDLIKNVKYISCVSGGAWASICYTYCKESINDERLLGKYISPAQLTMKDLKKTEDSSIIKCISNSYVIGKYWGSVPLGRGDEIFSYALNQNYLKPLAIGDRNSYFTYKKEHADTIRKNNPSLKQNNFYLTKKDRPYLIVNGTVVGNARNAKKLPSMHFEMTPLYSGVTYHSVNKKKLIIGEYPIGGGYYESFTIDSRFLKRYNDSTAAVRRGWWKKRTFTLSDMMAISGDAPGTTINRIPVGKYITGNLGMPEIKLWSPYQFYDTDRKHMFSNEYIMGDGGNLENLGLIPLLKRKVDKIIVFVNSLRPVTKKESGEIDVDPALTRIFGEPVKTLYAISTNLLSNEAGEYDSLKKQLHELKEQGKPLICSGTYKVNFNPDYGIIPNEKWNTVQIMWVYNDNFEPLYVRKNLNPEVANEYYFKKFDCMSHTFPHLPTVLSSGKLRMIDYENEWANLLAHFSSWVIMDNSKIIVDFLENNPAKIKK